MQPGPSVDLNADLGESFGRWCLGDDQALLGVITSANVACGFHAGDPLTLRRTCADAAAAGVVIGAQVSYRDLAGFGRRFIDVAPDDLAADVHYQIGALRAMAAAAGTTVRYVKPHGALYHATIDHEAQATAVVEAVQAANRGDTRPLALLGFPGSELLRIGADAGLLTVTEYFVDRRYTDDGRLVDRRDPDALITDPEEAATRARTAALEQRAGSFCLHGDSPGAAAFAVAVRARLVDAGVALAPFAA